MKCNICGKESQYLCQLHWHGWRVYRNKRGRILGMDDLGILSIRPQGELNLCEKCSVEFEKRIRNVKK